MVYSTENAKWKAYQFSDPFAAGSFYVCNKINQTICRPDCDARARTNLKSEIKFFDSARDAIDCGYTACTSCDPLSSPPIDVNFLIKCVASINKQIGFLPPLLDDNEEVNNQKIKDNIIESKKTNEEQILQAFGGRRLSVPVIPRDGKFAKSYENQSLCKNDSDHYRLVDLACRHLALAAAMNIFQPQAVKSPESPSDTESPDSATASATKKRRRRGGVLGFKELAAKSKLSAWHFHRVFKSVTGLTPKTYGDKCWEYMKKSKDSGEPTLFTASPTNHVYHTPVSSNESSPVQFQPPAKRVKLENDSHQNLFEEPHSISYYRQPQPPSQEQQSTTMKYTVPHANSFDLNFQPSVNTDNFNIYNQEDQYEMIFNRACSEPNLSLFNTPTLFGHTKTSGPLYEQAQVENQSSYTSPIAFQPKQNYDQAINSISPELDLNQDILDPALNLVGQTETEIFNELNIQLNLDGTIPSLVNDESIVFTDDKKSLFDVNLSPEVFSNSIAF